MKVDAGRGKLYDAQLVARGRWQDIEEHWDDINKREFLEKIWGPLEQLVNDQLRAIDRLAVVFRECQRHCQGQD